MGIASKGGRPRLVSDVLDESNTAYAMWRAGAFDSAIAKSIDVCISAVTTWRKRNGLQCNRQRMLDENNAERMSLYNQGLSDDEIGAAVGVSGHSIKGWRKRRHLKKI